MMPRPHIHRSLALIQALPATSRDDPHRLPVQLHERVLFERGIELGFPWHLSGSIVMRDSSWLMVRANHTLPHESDKRRQLPRSAIRQKRRSKTASTVSTAVSKAVSTISSWYGGKK